MSKLKIYDMKGASVGDLEIADNLLVLDKGDQVLHAAVRGHLAARRAGTASTLRKGEVAGSNKKPWRQKGTGRARAGYRQSPVWRGGAVAFGPHPRDFGFKINKKEAKLAFKRAFSERISSGEVRILDELVLSEAKTKSFVKLLKSLKIVGPALFVVDKIDDNVRLAARNVPDVEIVDVASVSVHHLVRYPVIVVSKACMETVKSRLSA